MTISPNFPNTVTGAVALLRRRLPCGIRINSKLGRTRIQIGNSFLVVAAPAVSVMVLVRACGHGCQAEKETCRHNKGRASDTPKIFPYSNSQTAVRFVSGRSSAYICPVHRSDRGAIEFPLLHV